MHGGAIGYVVPHSVYLPGYHCDPKQPLPFAGLASQKNHMGIYLMCVYDDPESEAWFREAWTKTSKKLDMGKSDGPLHECLAAARSAKKLSRYLRRPRRPPRPLELGRTDRGW